MSGNLCRCGAYVNIVAAIACDGAARGEAVPLRRAPADDAGAVALLAATPGRATSAAARTWST